MMETMDEMLVGGIAVGSFVAGLFFLRYWRSTGDRFFLFFMLSFWIESANRLLMGFTQASNADTVPLHYIVRLVSYGLILWAIWEKNRPPSK